MWCPREKGGIPRHMVIALLTTIECLRDIGLEQECLDIATPSHHMSHTRWCWSMAGDEFARVYSWGYDPKHKASPLTVITMTDLGYFFFA